MSHRASKYGIPSRLKGGRINPAWTKERNAKSKTSIRAWREQYRKEHPDITRLWNWRSHLLSNYGIRESDYNKMLKKQNGLCAICHRKDARRLSVDHDHATGKVRGLLCVSCNVRLAALEDKRFVRKAKAYLLEVEDVT